MKKILYIIDHDIRQLGGSQLSTKTIINEMLKSGNKVALLMETDNEEPLNNFFINNECKVYRIKERKQISKIKYFFMKVKKIKEIIKDFDPEIIHPQNPSAGIIVGFMKKYKLISKKIKCVYTDRAMLSDYSKLLNMMFKHVSNSWDCLVTTTKKNQKEWNENAKTKRICHIPNVLEDKWFEYDADKEKMIKEKYNAGDKLVIGFSGRYVIYKKWDTVLKIIKELKNENNVIFAFAIANADEEKQLEFLGTMNEYIKKIKTEAPNSVLILNASEQEMMNFYYLTDIFVLTSSVESFGRTLIEAMTKNTSVIGTNVGGVPEVINNKNFIYEVDDYKYVIKKIKEYIFNKEKLEEDKKYFLNYSNNTFNSKILNKKLNELYESLGEIK